MADLSTLLTHENLENRDALEEAIVANYESPEEQEAARTVLGSVYGVDFATGVSLDGKTAGATQDQIEDPDKAAEEDEVAKALKVLEDKEKPADAAAAAEAEKAKAGGEEDDAAKALRERDERIAELETQVALAGADKDIREAVSVKLQERLDEQQTLSEAEEAKIKEFEETHGEEAAAEYRRVVETGRESRQAENDRFQEDEIGKARAEKEAELSGMSATQRAIYATPDLRSWHEEARQADGGDATKSADRYNLAVSIDAALKERDDWKGKPMEDRFAKVVEMVKASTDAGSSGSPGASEQETDKGKAAATEKAIADEIARKAKQGGEAGGMPGSLSSIPGGEAPTDIAAKLESMNMTDLAGLNLSTDAIDRLAEGLDEDDEGEK